jgi:hypothetical protein
MTDALGNVTAPAQPNRNDITVPGNYVVYPNYDNGFTADGRVTTLTELIATREAQQTDRLSLEFFNKAPKKPKVETPFLFMLVLKISVPSTKAGDTPYKDMFKKNAFNKKAKQNGSYKKCILLADLGDPNQLTAVILEESNEDHNRLFARDKTMERVAVGQRCAIMSPKLEGNQLKNGAWVLTTNRPLEFLSAPRVPTRTLRSERVGHEIRYFVMKGIKIHLLDNDVVDPLKTMCNFHSCDRQNASKLRTQTNCGCWMQNKQMDNSPRNTVLMFTFYFSDANRNIIQVKDFTSLKTSKLFFKNQNILAEMEDLHNNSVYSYVQTQWRKGVAHVNDNGGWTIVGWFIRATIDEDDRDEADETLFRANVKINVSYLYPSTQKGYKIPEGDTIDQTKLKELICSGNNATAQTDISDFGI